MKQKKIVINDPRPYLRHNEYKSRYNSSNDHSRQQTIRDSRDSKYFVNKNHPEYNNWKNSQRNQKYKNSHKSSKKQKDQEHDNDRGRK